MRIAVCDSRVLVERGLVSYTQDVPPQENLSPFGRKLLADLRAAGAVGLESARLKFAGAQKELRNLARLDLAVSLGGGIFISREAYGSLVGRIMGGIEPRSAFPISHAKDRTGLSRKYVIPLLNRMESDGLVRREGDMRIVTRKPSHRANADAT